MLELRKGLGRILDDFERVTLTYELVNEFFPRVGIVIHDEHVGLLGFHGFAAACRITPSASMEHGR